MSSEEIDLGWSTISEKKWTDGYDPEGEDGELAGLNPDEIIVSKQEITIEYDYPLTGLWKFTHKTDNPNGFTRRELSVSIMNRYHSIYEEERQTRIKEEEIKNNSLPILNRQKTNGKYGIWGHCIGDLILHTLYIDSNGNYSLGIDS